MITADELSRMPADKRCELVKGKLRTLNLSGFEHGVIANNFQVLLGERVRIATLGTVVGAGTGFRCDVKSIFE